MKPHSTTVRIPCQDLRRKFNANEGGYPAKINSLKWNCSYDGLASPKSGQPPGTRSQLRVYFDGALPVMWLHCFLLPSGELGGSGRMDPKRLFVAGIYYYCS